MSQDFFDIAADDWDRRLQPIDFEAALRFLKRAGVGEGDALLDVGAGTGILVPFCRELGVSKYLAIELSKGMCGVFSRKFPHEKILHADFCSAVLSKSFYSVAFFFNCFSHFSDPSRVFEKALSVLAPGGKLVIAHAMGRQALNKYHRERSPDVAEDILPSDEQFRELFAKFGFFNVDIEDGAQGFFALGVSP